VGLRQLGLRGLIVGKEGRGAACHWVRVTKGGRTDVCELGRSFLFVVKNYHARASTSGATMETKVRAYTKHKSTRFKLANLN
jgi:hypothetical protein